jgi:hypothetical protein
MTYLSFSDIPKNKKEQRSWELQLQVIARLERFDGNHNLRFVSFERRCGQTAIVAMAPERTVAANP